MASWVQNLTPPAIFLFVLAAVSPRERVGGSQRRCQRLMGQLGREGDGKRWAGAGSWGQKRGREGSGQLRGK
jgi:hypothetical protein